MLLIHFLSNSDSVGWCWKVQMYCVAFGFLEALSLDNPAANLFVLVWVLWTPPSAPLMLQPQHWRSRMREKENERNWARTQVVTHLRLMVWRRKANSDGTEEQITQKISYSLSSLWPVLPQVYTHDESLHVACPPSQVKQADSLCGFVHACACICTADWSRASHASSIDTRFFSPLLNCILVHLRLEELSLDKDQLLSFATVPWIMRFQN